MSDLRTRLAAELARIELRPVLVNGRYIVLAEAMADALLPFIQAEIDQPSSGAVVTGPCCSIHVAGAATRPAPWLGEGRVLAPCCDPNDCGACCPACPTCPSLQSVAVVAVHQVELGETA